MQGRPRGHWRLPHRFDRHHSRLRALRRPCKRLGPPRRTVQPSNPSRMLLQPPLRDLHRRCARPRQLPRMRRCRSTRVRLRPAPQPPHVLRPHQPGRRRFLRRPHMVPAAMCSCPRSGARLRHRRPFAAFRQSSRPSLAGGRRRSIRRTLVQRARIIGPWWGHSPMRPKQASFVRASRPPAGSASFRGINRANLTLALGPG
jgi:hypothetical protein